MSRTIQSRYGSNATVSNFKSGEVRLSFTHYTGLTSFRDFESRAEYKEWAKKGGFWPSLS